MEVLYQPGDIIQNQYRIVGVLGQGGTAVTYEAVDLSQPDLSVAVKVLSLQQTNDWKLLELFEREVKVLKNLDHPRIPQYLDYFSIDTEHDRQFMLVQELIPGKSLGDLVEQGWYFPEEEVKNITQQVLEILTYLHGFQPPVIHRDIKPHNIIRTDQGEIYLVDLGAVQDVYRNTLTRGATFVGTIDYMSPEQLRGHASFASDLYSLGCTILYLLTKRSPSELPLQRMKINFRSSLKINPQFADWLDKILEPVLEDRFCSTKEALTQLDRQPTSITNIKPLVGSSIKIKQQSDKLIINIPPAKKLMKTAIKTAVELLLSLIIAIPFLSFALGILNYFIVSISTFNFWLLIFTACIWSVFILTATIFITRSFSLLFIFFGQIYLRIEPEKYQIAWKCLGIRSRTLGSTSSIEAITVTTRNLKHDSFFPAHEHCVIYEGTKEHQFGMWLTKAERRWLVTTIANFVTEQYPNKNKQDWLRDLWKLG
ncbi:MAG: serine/threonine-protein kinase [Cyanobacteria bacterium P01_E01_bin.35]